MEKATFILSIFFAVLTPVGAALVICLGLNAGYAVIPCVFATICNLLYKGNDTFSKGRYHK